MQILFVLFGSRGDVVPSAALAAAARKAGHSVCMMVPREYLLLVPEGVEAVTYCLTHSGQYEQKKKSGPAASDELDKLKSITEYVRLEMETLYAGDNFDTAVDELLGHARRLAADVIVADSNTTPWAINAAEYLGVNCVVMMPADVMPRVDKFALASDDNAPPAFLTLYIHYMYQTHHAVPPVLARKIAA